MSYTAACILGVVGILVIAAIVVFIIWKRADSKNTFNYVFNREVQTKWSRQCSDPLNRDLNRMFEYGTDWARNNRDYKEEISCATAGGQLHAQYFNFGSKSAVIIVPGMYESSSYSYYYAEIYKQAGYNLCLIDNRATGLSFGQFNTIGYEEKKDVVEWARCLHDMHGIDSVILHGISMGASTCVLALNEPNCPSYVKAFISDECYTDFRTYFRKFFEYKTWRLSSFNSVLKKLEEKACNPDLVAPVSCIDHVEVPTLFLFGNQDQLISKEDAASLYEKLGTAVGNKDKEIVWFDYGLHGFLRSSDPDKYDQSIADFLTGHNLVLPLNIEEKPPVPEITQNENI